MTTFPPTQIPTREEKKSSHGILSAALAAPLINISRRGHVALRRESAATLSASGPNRLLFVANIGRKTLTFASEFRDDDLPEGPI